MSSYKKTKLSEEQKRAFDLIIEDVEKPVKEKPLILFVCGSAGTGKSELIKHLFHTVGEYHVLLTAMTAMAARNIGGFTAHRGFLLNPKLSANGDGYVLPHPHLKLVIIDEISMCDDVLFQRIERRLRQLMNNPNVPFGGCTVVMFGDLLQIPPVEGDWIFKSPLWQNHVRYIELETIIRQEKDPEFGKMLKRWRLGYTTDEDKVFLNTIASSISQTDYRGYISHFQKNYTTNQNMMILAYTNPVIATLNRLITLKLFPNGDDLYRITLDTHTLLKDQENPQVKRQPMFKIGVDSRVMVKQNISGFINGDIAIVRKIESECSGVKSITLEIQATKATQIMERSTSRPIISGEQRTWTTEFPIQPSYAVTYHKAQGQTLDKVLLFTREKIPPALFYVGASRVRTRHDLHVLSPDSHLLVRADSAAIAEYKRLRRKIGLSDLPTV